MLRTLCEPKAAVTIDSLSSRMRVQVSKLASLSGFCRKTGTTPAVLRRFDLFVIPVGAFHEADGEARSARAAPIDQVAQIALGVAQVSLNDDAGVRPILEFRLGEERSEKFERGIFVRVALHVEIDEGADFLRAAQDRAELRREMRDRILRVGRIHLRIERGDFYGNDSRPGTARRLCRADRSSRGSVSRSPSSRSKQRAAYSSASCSLTTASPSRSTVNPIFSFRRLRSVFITSSGFRPAMNCRAIPETFQRRIGAVSHGKNARGAQAGLQERHEAVAHAGKIFVEMLDDVAGAAQGREHIDEAEHLHLEMLVPHRERHHPLVKAGFAENRFRIPINQLENSPAALFDLALEGTHRHRRR